MKRTFVYVENFNQKWRQYGLSSEELQELELQLLMKSKQGDVATETGRLLKVRFSPKRKQRGKAALIGSFTSIFSFLPIQYSY
jgi:hypothetical protein